MARRSRDYMWLVGPLSVLCVAAFILGAVLAWNAAMRHWGHEGLMIDLMELHRRGFFVG